ncbi:MAG: peptide ABC transporter substrate-binding protein [Opitutaceae bacterium]|nr:peptide ABC transporter substrate-binding protein [Opitutaceae bacterium]
MLPRRQFLPLALAACALALALPGCGKRETPVDRGIREQVLAIGTDADLTDLDPQLVTGAAEFNVLIALFEGLTDLDPATLDPIPAIAERWETSDLREWTFHLSAAARWSDGTPITAQDFIASWRRLLTPALGADYASLLYPVVGAEEFNRGRLTDFAQVGLSAPHPQTLVIRLRQPIPHLPALLALPPLFPVPLHVIEKCGPVDRRGNPWTRPGTFVGNGPFELREWRPGQIVATERSPTFRDAAAVRLHGVRFHLAENLETEERMYRAGQLHVVSALATGRVDTWQRDHSPALHQEAYFGTDFLRVNVSRPPLDDPRVRRALALAIDRNLLAERVLLGTKRPAPALVPPGFPGYAGAPRIPTDGAEARRLLAEAGFPNGTGLRPLQLLYNSSDQHRIVFEAIQEMWTKELGVTVQLASQENKTFRQTRRSGDYDLLRSSWTADYRDPMTFLEVFASGSGNNHTRWRNAAYDGLLTSAGASTSLSDRLAQLSQAESLLLAEAPIIPLYHYTNFYLVHPSVRGWSGNPIDRRPLKQLWLEPANR